MTATITTRPQFLNANNAIYTFWDLRSMDDGVPPGEGVEGHEAFKVIQRQAGANMSVDIGASGAGLMRAWVRGDTREGQGLYLVDNIDRSAPTASTYVAQLNDTITANASGNPRLDQVILEVLDAQHTGASSLAQIRVVAGTPTAAADLDNRNGAAALPATAILLADVIVANGAASIVTANIRSRRPFPCRGALPSLLTSLDQVMLEPAAGLYPATTTYTHATMDTMQSAALMYLPRRIVGATRVRLKYRQGGTANTGNFAVGLYDASGRILSNPAPVAFSGAANAYVEVAITITALTLEAGYYYVLFGWDSATAAATSTFHGCPLGMDNGVSSATALVPYRNVGLRSAANGTTVPTTILALTDVAGLAADTVIPPVPIVTLSVG